MLLCKDTVHAHRLENTVPLDCIWFTSLRPHAYKLDTSKIHSSCGIGFVLNKQQLAYTVRHIPDSFYRNIGQPGKPCGTPNWELLGYVMTIVRATCIVERTCIM